jgi:hypothetical protein
LPAKAVSDPQREDEEGQAFRIDGDLDRGDARAKYNFLLKKYGVRTTVFSMHEFQGIAAVPDPDSGDSQSN